jgi:hypothetical protein
MIFRPFLTIDIIALVALAISFFMSIKLVRLMGKGKDAEPAKILIIVTVMNGLLGLLLLMGGYQKYLQDYLMYVRMTDIILMIAGIVLAVSIFKVYTDYKKLIRKHEPNL